MDTGRVALLIELQSDVPRVVADATLQALAVASPQTQTGGELRRLRATLSDAARLTTSCLVTLLRDKSHAVD